MKISLASPRYLAIKNTVIRNMLTYLPMLWLQCFSLWTHTQVLMHLPLLAWSRCCCEATIRLPSRAVLPPLWKEALLWATIPLSLAPLLFYPLTCSSCCIMVLFQMMISAAEHIVLLITWIMFLFLAEYIFLEPCIINHLFQALRKVEEK